MLLDINTRPEYVCFDNHRTFQVNPFVVHKL